MITLGDYLLFTAFWVASIFITVLIYNKRVSSFYVDRDDC